MKLFVLMCIFLNVLVMPWGLAREQTIGAVLLAVPLVLVKILCFLLVLVVYRVLALETPAFSHHRIFGCGIHYVGGGDDRAGFFALNRTN